MSLWQEIRRQATLKHESLASSTEALVVAKDLLVLAQADTGIAYEVRPLGDPLLDGAEAAYCPDYGCIYISEGVEPGLAVFYIAHEYAHHWLDATQCRCGGEDLDCLTPAEAEMSYVGEADSYSPKERAEAQANVFAREFLLPRRKLRALCCREVFDAERIAVQVGVPVDLVMQQLADALLLPEEPAESKEERREAALDDSQKSAIEGTAGARLVRAGPGTGKTRTLVGKVKDLLESGEAPESLLVLTFSNVSAQDLAERIRAAVGEGAPAVWVGTFHAFGLELVRKHGEAMGLGTQPRLLDRSGSLMLLEELVPELNLEHYLDLRDPLLKLRSVLALISRAKDELVTPERYEECARAAAKTARDEAEREEAQKALEAARIYSVYQRTLEERGLVDFGDLIACSVKLLQTCPELHAALRAERRHILVDEYQDMNRASGILLRELVEPGRGPWVVGDIRQSIYRFRGASPLNMARFGQDFPDATTADLGVNYRSEGRIVRAFEAFGARMACANLAPSQSLQAYRGEKTGRVEFEVALTFEAECEGIANTILSDVARGRRFGDHAILARSHTTLCRLARHLDRSGVPCLYFGDFFERGEIRDLLSLLSVVSERAGVGLFRAAQMPQYDVPSPDLVTVFRWRREQHVSMLQALRRVEDIPGLSAMGRSRLTQLAADLAHADYPTHPHRFLLKYLFKRGAHLQSFIADDTVAGQQRRLAIYQLLQYAGGFRALPGTDPKRDFLEHVRRLEALDEEKQLRSLPAAAGAIDAVRMMTVHAAKGLEFPIVHIPSVTSRHFPVNRPESNRLPKGLISCDGLMSREAEEESLFFVALSRAQDELHLSRAIAYGGWADVKPSPYLSVISTWLPRSPNASATWIETGPRGPADPILAPPEKREVWSVYAVELYLDCPLRFYYAEVLQLGGDGGETPYRRLNSTLRSTISDVCGIACAKERRTLAFARLGEKWEQDGPRGHSLEGLYRQAAEQMLATALDVLDGKSLPSELRLDLPSGVVVSGKADYVSACAEGVVLRRLKTGRLAKTEKAKPRYAVLQAALCKQYPDNPVWFEHVSLLTGERRRSRADGKKLRTEALKVESALAGIAEGRFGAVPGDSKCPYCPYYFICPCQEDIIART